MSTYHGNIFNFIPPRKGYSQHPAAVRAKNCLTMEDLLGINAGDFEGIDFVDSDEEEPASTTGCAAMAAAAAGAKSPSDSNDSNGRASSTTPQSERTTRTTVEAPRTAFVTTVETQVSSAVNHPVESSGLSNWWTTYVEHVLYLYYNLVSS